MQVMSTMGTPQDPRELPLYDPSEAAPFIGVSPAALAEWMRPNTDEAESSAPLLQLVEPSSGRLSFANLVEAHILEATRQQNVSSAVLRRAVDALRTRKHETKHPLLTREFNERGKRHFLESLASSTRGSPNPSVRVGHLAAKLDRYLERIERDTNDDPYQVFPMRRNGSKYVALNIGLAAGHPVIAGTGVRVQHLSNLIQGGLSVASVATRYRLKEDAVAGALRFLAA